MRFKLRSYKHSLNLRTKEYASINLFTAALCLFLSRVVSRESGKTQCPFLLSVGRNNRAYTTAYPCVGNKCKLRFPNATRKTQAALHCQISSALQGGFFSYIQFFFSEVILIAIIVFYIILFLLIKRSFED